MQKQKHTQCIVNNICDVYSTQGAGAALVGATQYKEQLRLSPVQHVKFRTIKTRKEHKNMTQIKNMRNLFLHLVFF